VTPDLAGALVGGTVALSGVLGLTVLFLAARYRRECAQLRVRNTELSVENDRWHEDFAAQAGELTALRDGLHANCAYRVMPHAEAS
jgi:hypothetical protein